MKSNSHNLENDRFYEITHVEEGDAWYVKPGNLYCVLGAIIQPTEMSGRFKIIKKSTTGYLTVTGAEPENYLYLGQKMQLRPLNKKDQAKLQRVRDQFA